MDSEWDSEYALVSEDELKPEDELEAAYKASHKLCTQILNPIDGGHTSSFERWPGASCSCLFPVLLLKSLSCFNQESCLHMSFLIMLNVCH